MSINEMFTINENDRETLKEAYMILMGFLADCVDNHIDNDITDTIDEAAYQINNVLEMVE